ncbi:MAG: hypothetical protein MZV64_67920 [Ignavibacteriales bacterium]|nr:hypothetical protein [Ignavibacteriales bacterium]
MGAKGAYSTKPRRESNSLERGSREREEKKGGGRAPSPGGMRSPKALPAEAEGEHRDQDVHLVAAGQVVAGQGHGAVLAHEVFEGQVDLEVAALEAEAGRDAVEGEARRQDVQGRVRRGSGS